MIVVDWLQMPFPINHDHEMRGPSRLGAARPPPTAIKELAAIEYV
jgi:hypothetical protein